MTRFEAYRDKAIAAMTDAAQLREHAQKLPKHAAHFEAEARFAEVRAMGYLASADLASRYHVEDGYQGE